MTTILNGLLGGAIVAIVAALAARLVHDGPPVTATLFELTSGDGKPSRWADAILVLGYGSVVGGMLVALELFVLDVVAIPPTVGEAVTIFAAWSVVLLVVALAVWRLSPLRPGPSHLREIVVFHLVFGFGLGVWVRMTWIT